MNTLYCLLMLATALIMADALKCYCDKDHCLSGTGPSEECPLHVPGSFIERDMQKYEDRLTEAIASAIVQTSAKEDSLPEKKQATEKAGSIVKNMTIFDKISMLEFLGEIAYDNDLFTRGRGSMGEIKTKLHAVAAGVATPKQINNQFCLKTNDAKQVIQGCGAAVTLDTGPIYEGGCHTVENMLYSKIRYCRCKKDLCNSGNAMSASLAVSLVGCLMLLLSTPC